MNQTDLIQLVLYLATILIFVKPLGRYMADIYQGKTIAILKYIFPFERFIYRLCRIDPAQEMDWKQYLAAMLFFNLLGVIALYFLQRLQVYLPLNYQHFAAVDPQLAFNTAASITSNTGWQSYAGESSLSIFTQCLGIGTQSFLSAATGMSILIAFIRGISRHETENLGNYWQDMVRSILYILLPLALILALALSTQGVMQNFKPYQKSFVLDSVQKQEETIIPMGPIASFVAIKQLSSAGAGFFNVNSAHPFENPNQITNFLEMVAILLIPAAFCYTFGIFVNDRRQGWVLFITMILLFTISASGIIHFEKQGNPAFREFELDRIENMEGKELRLNVINSSIWATATTATGSGTVNCMHDSLMPLSAAIALTLMHVGETIFGSVGSGLYGMIMMVMITVFIAGLMAGRTPEYLGKKIEPFEMQMITIMVLIMPLISLVLTGWASVSTMGVEGLGNPGSHGFSEILYALTSMRNTNGSAMAGLNANNNFYNICGGLTMLLSRYWQAIAVLAVAGSLVRKKIIPTTNASLATNNILFLFILIFVIFTLSILSFLPTLALGPVTEYITIKETYGG